MSWVDYYKEEEALAKNASGKGSGAGKSSELPPPPNFSAEKYRDLKDGRLKEGKLTKRPNPELERLKRKRLFDITIGPTKQIPMNAIMMYMSPNSIQLIPMMMTFMVFVNAVKEILSVNKKFADADTESCTKEEIITMKGGFVLCCMGNLLVGLWKLNAMGLIPNKTGDWISWESTLGAAESVIM